MIISEIISRSPFKINVKVKDDFEVTGLSNDSRAIKPGNIFFAIRGFKDDGNKFIEEALAKGAGLIFTESEADTKSRVPMIRVEGIRRLMAALSGIYYDDPSGKLKLIGITGTNGKTTTSYLLQSFLNDAGFKTGLIGTINYQTGSEKLDSRLTTPDSVELNMMLDEMVRSKMDYCVMEVSSIALVMERVYGLKFDTAIFTNLTSEHLDFHKDMNNYFEAKKILFDTLPQSSYAVSNADDAYGENILNDCNAEKFYYSVNSKSNLRSFNEKLSLNGIEFDVKWNGETYTLKSGLAGRFNIYNILASVSAVLKYDIDMLFIRESLLKFKEVAGRFNRIALPNGAIAVIDYSHTSDSLKNAIESAREIVTEEKKKGRVITIFGCGGNKDRTKRPVMGEIATTLSDYSIITSDNPRFEKPLEIIDEILTGIKNKNNLEIIENREDAIKRGIEISREADILLICGKGHETYQEINGVREHFDDKEIIDKYSISAK